MTNNKQRKRGFELISQYAGRTGLLPKRETAHAAGYDIKAAETLAGRFEKEFD